MKKLITATALSVIATAALAGNLSTEKQQTSYTLGAGLGKNLKRDNVNIDAPSFAQGMTDAYSGNKMQLSDAKMNQLIQKFKQKQLKRSQGKVQELAAENAKKSEAFLAANAKKDGVKEGPDGLQYKVLEAGTGEHPTGTSTVTVDYEGKLIDGKVFDSSYKRGQPATFPLNHVIPGWQKGIPLMKVGGTWEFYIPSKLAYGANGVPGAIGPNDALIFKVHLIKIDK